MFVIVQTNPATERRFLSVEVDHGDRGQGHLGGYWVHAIQNATRFPFTVAMGIERAGWGRAIPEDAEDSNLCARLTCGHSFGCHRTPGGYCKHCDCVGYRETDPDVTIEPPPTHTP